MPRGSPPLRPVMMPYSGPRVRTPRMQLRPIRAEDREEFVRVHEASRALHEAWTPSLGAGHDFGDLFDAELARARRGERDGTQLRLVGILADGRIGGFFNLGDVVRGVFHNAYASWKINAEVARTGLATEGVRALLDVAFAESPGLALHRVQANVIPTNVASLRVAEKAGFRREGYALRYLKIAGEWQDHVMLAKLADEHVPTGWPLAWESG